MEEFGASANSGRPIFSNFSAVVNPLVPATAAPKMLSVHGSSIVHSVLFSPFSKRVFNPSAWFRANSLRSPSQSIIPPLHLKDMASSRRSMYSFTVNNDEDREQRASRGQRDGQESFFFRAGTTRRHARRTRRREREKNRSHKTEKISDKADIFKPVPISVRVAFEDARANKNERRRRITIHVCVPAGSTTTKSSATAGCPTASVVAARNEAVARRISLSYPSSSVHNGRWFNLINRLSSLKVAPRGGKKTTSSSSSSNEVGGTSSKLLNPPVVLAMAQNDCESEIARRRDDASLASSSTLTQSVGGGRFFRRLHSRFF